MSKYTTQLRWVIEQTLDDAGLPHTEDSWKSAYKALGLDDYPIYDESHRDELNHKIIRRYYFREVGFETVALFRWYMRSTMHEIMPYYNQLYPTELLVTQPMLSVSRDYSETWTRDENTSRDTTADTTSDTETHGTGTAHDQSDERNVFQDTPMNGLDTGAIESMDYATNVTYDHSVSDGSTTSTGTASNVGTRKGTDAYSGDFDGTRTHSERGFDKSQSELLLEYRKTILNIDSEIVDRLSTLFMQLW